MELNSLDIIQSSGDNLISRKNITELRSISNFLRMNISSQIISGAKKKRNLENQVNQGGIEILNYMKLIILGSGSELNDSHSIPWCHGR